MENYEREQVLVRLTGNVEDIFKILRDLEGLYNTRLFPDTPEPDRRYGGTRVYVKIPTEVLKHD
jgi:hypothetical protein